MNKTALITGGTSGIGLAIAEKLASQGYNLCLNGLEKDGEAITADLSHRHGIDCWFSSANLLRHDELIKFTAQALSKFKVIDVLVNNAGIQYVSPIDSFPDEQWNNIIGLNLTAVFSITKALWPAMKNQGYGRIINMASAHGHTASAYKSAYVASKHGLIGFTKAIALEGAALGITCNAVCPGYVKTPIIDKQIDDQMRAHNMNKEEVIEKVMLAKQPIKSFIPLDIVADTVAFLASEKAATITGASFNVDGGWTAE